MIKEVLVRRKWRLVCTAEWVEGQLMAKVAPEEVPANDPLFRLYGTTSAIQIKTDTLNQLTLLETAPTPAQTAFGVLADLISAARGHFSQRQMRNIKRARPPRVTGDAPSGPIKSSRENAQHPIVGGDDDGLPAAKQAHQCCGRKIGRHSGHLLINHRRDGVIHTVPQRSQMGEQRRFADHADQAAVAQHGHLRDVVNLQPLDDLAHPISRRGHQQMPPLGRHTSPARLAP
jgi:hypothetical protein